MRDLRRTGGYYGKLGGTSYGPIRLCIGDDCPSCVRDEPIPQPLHEASAFRSPAPGSWRRVCRTVPPQPVEYDSVPADKGIG